MERTLLSLCHLIIRCGSVFVPAAGRSDWRDEWTAEVAHAWMHTAGSPPAARWALVRRCLGALPDSLVLFAAEWLPALQADAWLAAFRDLGRTPLRFAVTVSALALCLASAAGTLSAARSLLRPTLPYPHAERYVRIEHGERIPGAVVRPFSRAEFDAIRRGTAGTFEIVGAGRLRAERVHGPGGTAVAAAAAAAVSPETFALVPLAPVLGRGLDAADGAPGAEPVVVLSYDLWLAEFSGARGILGTLVSVGDVPRRVVGVMPREFSLLERGPQLWLPLAADPSAGAAATSRDLCLVGRLRPGASVAQARLAVDAALAAAAPACLAPAGGSTSVDRIAPPLAERLPHPMRVALALLPCLAALPLASGAGWLRGAPGPRRLSRALVLALASLALAAPLAGFVTAAIARALPPRVDPPSLSLDGGLALLLVVALVAALVRFSRGPAPSRPAPARRVLALLPVAGALPILVLSLATGRAWHERAGAGRGVDARGLWAIGVELGEGAPIEAARRVCEAARSVDGIADASVASAAPFDGVMRSVSVTSAPNGTAPGAGPIETSLRAVDDGYFRTLTGPDVTGDDQPSHGAIVNRALAARLWPGAVALPPAAGIRVLLDAWVELPVVGIVEDFPAPAGPAGAAPEVFVDLDRAASRTDPNGRRVQVLVRARASSDPAALRAQLTRALAREASAVGSVRAVEAARERLQRRPRAMVHLAGLGVLLAVTLAGLGFVGQGTVPRDP